MQYDRTKTKKVEDVLKQLEAEHGHSVCDPALRFTVRNETVVTTPTEFRLIEFLAFDPERVFTVRACSTASGMTPP